MRRPFVKRIISAVLILLMIAPYMAMSMDRPMAVYGDTNTDLNNAKDKQSDINSQLENTRKEIDDLKNQTSDTAAYIAQLDAKITTIDTSLTNLNAQISTKQVEINDAETNLAKAQQDSEEQYEAMKLRIKFMYEHNSENFLVILLESTSMADLLNKAEYITKISEYDREMLTKYQETVTFISNTKAQLETDYADMDKMKASLEGQKQSVKLVQDTKTAQLAKLNVQTAKAQEKESSLAADLAAQESVITAMEAKIKAEEEAKKKQPTIDNKPSDNSSSDNSGATSSGQMIWPTKSTRITSPYGDTEDRASGHNGVDIGALTPGVSGDPIYAAASGTVTKANYSSSAGNWIWIYHGDGLYSVYMHCNSLNVSVGQEVTQGQVIASMGTTGNSTGVHLHFGVRKNGAYVNPMPYLGR